MDTNAKRHLVHSFLCNHPLGVVSTVGADGAPETAAVYFMLDADLTCYFVSKEQTRKFKNISERRNATLSVYDENVLMFGELKGKAESLESTDETIAKVTALQETIDSRKADYWLPPVSQLQAGKYTVFRLRPDEVTFYNFNNASTAEITEPVKVTLSGADLQT